MTLALFDLDNTLLKSDSDYEWGQFLVSKKLVDVATYEAENRRFYEDYQKGSLDIYAYSRFAFKPLAEFAPEMLLELHKEFMETIIQPLITDEALALVKKHQHLQQTLLVITATNRFITAPIVKALGIQHLLATDIKIKNGRYLAEVDGIACFQSGKVERLKHWMISHQESLQGSWFYSDSHNDLPLLERVDHPVAVNPDEKLRQIAHDKRWPILTF